MLLGSQGISEVMGVMSILDLLTLLEPVESLLGSSGFLLLPEVPWQLKVLGIPEIQIFPLSSVLLPAPLLLPLTPELAHLQVLLGLLPLSLLSLFQGLVQVLNIILQADFHYQQIANLRAHIQLCWNLNFCLKICRSFQLGRPFHLKNSQIDNEKPHCSVSISL